jgi:hypothetical protein
VVAAIGFSAPADRFPKSRFRVVGPVVLEAARQVAEHLGYNPNGHVIENGKAHATGRKRKLVTR